MTATETRTEIYRELIFDFITGHAEPVGADRLFVISDDLKTATLEHFGLNSNAMLAPDFINEVIEETANRMDGTYKFGGAWHSRKGFYVVCHYGADAIEWKRGTVSVVNSSNSRESLNTWAQKYISTQPGVTWEIVAGETLTLTQIRQMHQSQTKAENEVDA